MLEVGRVWVIEALGKKQRIAAIHLKALKIKITYAWCIEGLKTTFNLERRYLEFKKDDRKIELFVSRLNCNKQCAQYNL